MCADFIDLKRTLDLFARYAVDYLHVDIMDGHYVPNLTLGIDFCKAVAAYSPTAFDVHLMIEHVDSLVPPFAELPGAVITFHPETCYHPLRTIQLIRRLGARPGIALDPSMPVENVRHLIPSVDRICVMTVNPGYAGQSLVKGSIEWINEAANYARCLNPDIEIEVDGNVSWENIPHMLKAGADVLVVGTSSLFERGRPLETNYARLAKLLDYFVPEREAVLHARE